MLYLHTKTSINKHQKSESCHPYLAQCDKPTYEVKLTVKF